MQSLRTIQARGHQAIRLDDGYHHGLRLRTLLNAFNALFSRGRAGAARALQLTPLQALQEKDETDLKILCEKDGGAASGVLAYRRPM